MARDQVVRPDRRRLLQGVAGVSLSLAAASFVAGCGGGMPGIGGVGTAEARPETNRLTLALTTSLCHAPQYLAEDLLVAEGFTQVNYLPISAVGVESAALAAGQADMLLTFAGPLIFQMDAGDPIVLLGGGHVGCLELFSQQGVRSILELKGKTITLIALNSAPHVFLISLLAQVGLDHRRDVTIRVLPQGEGLRAFEAGDVEAILTSPPWAQELRERKIGQSLVNSSIDKPWSQYFCCMIAGHRDFVRQHPVATKRAMRAILKGADICATDPDRAARTLVERGFTQSPAYALQAMQQVPYSKWREYDPEDTVRYYALRLYEAGMIKSSPTALIEKSTDWRFFNELKQELKA
jgi:NitT/TauT family transport system substrate-binding protein